MRRREIRLKKTSLEFGKVILGVQEVGIFDNYFDWAGIRYWRQTGRETQGAVSKAITVADLFQHPTLERLASFLADGEGGGSRVRKAPRTCSAIKLREGARHRCSSSQATWGTSTRIYGSLVRHLPSDMPVYGMQDGIGHPSSIRKLAAALCGRNHRGSTQRQVSHRRDMFRGGGRV